MNATNRVSNRALLLIVGLTLLGAAGAVLLPLLPAGWDAGRIVHRATASTAGLRDWTTSWAVTLGGVTVQGPSVLALAGALILAILLIVFLATRGGGRTRTVLRFEGRSGTTTVDEAVTDAVLAAPLAQRADVISARARGFRVKGSPAIRLAIVPTAKASIPQILDAAQHAITDWDELAGTRIPVLIHVADRSGLERFRPATRVR